MYAGLGLGAAAMVAWAVYLSRGGAEADEDFGDYKGQIAVIGNLKTIKDNNKTLVESSFLLRFTEVIHLCHSRALEKTLKSYHAQRLSLFKAQNWKSYEKLILA